MPTEGKKEKMNGYWGLKTDGGEGKPKEKREMNVLVGAKTGAGVANLREKRENEWISRG